MTLTVPQAARRIGRNPETIRRWIREGRLNSTRVGTQYLIEELDLAGLVDPSAETAELPVEWQRTAWGTDMPDVVTALRRSREGH